MTENTTWLNWSVRTLTFPTTRFLPMYFRCQALALLSPFYVLRSPFFIFRSPFFIFRSPFFIFRSPFLFSVPRSLSTVRYHCCLIMLSVTFHMQIRLTTNKAVCKLGSKNVPSGGTQQSLRRAKNYYLFATCRSAELRDSSLLSAWIKNK